MKKRFNEEQIIGILKEAESGFKPAELCRKHGISESTYYGPEFASKVLDAWAYETGVTLSFIRPGKPVENAFVESFNGHFRDECLNEHGFVSMRHARNLIEQWRIEYNTERPHSSLGYWTPVQFAQAYEQQDFLTADSKNDSY